MDYHSYMMISHLILKTLMLFLYIHVEPLCYGTENKYGDQGDYFLVSLFYFKML